MFGRWQVARYWNLGVTGGYGNNRNVTPSAFLSTEGGHSLCGTITANRQLSERLNVGVRLHTPTGELWLYTVELRCQYRSRVRDCLLSFPKATRRIIYAGNTRRK